MNSLSRPAVGVLWVTGSCALGAILDVYFGHVLQGLDPIAAATICFGGVGVGAWLLELAQGGAGLLRLVRKDAADVVLVNFTSLLAAFGTMLTLRWLDPSTGKALYSSVPPLATIAIAPWLLGSQKVRKDEKIVAALVSLSMALLAWSVLAGNTAMGEVPLQSALLGIAAALITGIGIALNLILLKRLDERGWTIRQTFAVRLVLVGVVGSVVCVSRRNANLPGIHDLPALVLASLVWILLTTYALQRGIRALDPLVTALIVAAAPALTLAFQIFDPRLRFSAVSTSAVLLNVTIGIAAVSSRLRNSRSVEQDTFSREVSTH